MKRALLVALLASCYPTPDFRGQRPCEEGVTPCPSGQVCIEDFCQARNQAARLGADLNGKVQRSIDGLGALSPVAGAVVEIVGAGLFAQTDEFGQFRLRAIPEGQHQLVVLTASGTDLAQPRFEGAEAGRFDLLVEAADVGGTLRRDLILSPRGDLAGRIVLDGLDPFADVHGGVVVFVPGVAGAGDITGPNGIFLLADLPAGEHEIRVESAAHGPFTFVAQVDALARNWFRLDEPIPPANQSLDRRIEGRVQGAEKLAGGSLQLLAFPLFASGKQSIALDQDGRFSADLASPGPYVISLRGAGFRPAQRSGILAGQTDVELQAIVVQGEDLDEDGTSDAEDADRDGDGCLNESDVMPNDPRGCLDADGDGLPDDLDNDDDGDGASDVEEARPGHDGVVTDHRAVNTTQDGDVVIEQGDDVAISSDGILRIISADGDVSIQSPGEGFSYVAETQQEGLVYGPYGLVMAQGEGSVVRLLIANHPATQGDELQLLRRPAGCQTADCTLSARLDCRLSGYRGWLRCAHDLTLTGAVDERLWVRQGRRQINRMVDLNALKNAAPEEVQEVCLAMTSVTSVYAIFNRQIAVWRGEFRLGVQEVGQPHGPSCYGVRGDCVQRPIPDIDGDSLQIIAWNLVPATLIGGSPITEVNAAGSDPKLQVTSPLPGVGHVLTATISDGLSEPQTLSLNIVIRPLSSAVDCWLQ
jgi:hypothetical protein